MKARSLLLLFAAAAPVVCAWLMFLSPAAREARAWRLAETGGTETSCREYLERHPEGGHAAEALGMAGKLAWEAARQAATEPSARAYLERYPNGSHAGEAWALLDDLAWAVVADSAEQAGAYLKAWPDGRHRAEALVVLDEAQWAAARGDIGRLRQYLSDHAPARHKLEADEEIEELAWMAAQDDLERLRSYLAGYPQGRHRDAAHTGVEALEWRAAKGRGDTGTIRDFLQRHPAGAHAAEAGAALAEAEFKEFPPTIRGRMDYLEKHPKGQFAEQATKEIEELKASDTPWNEAVRKLDFSGFLHDYPGHKRAGDARAALDDSREGADIVTLIEKQKIEVQTSGNDIQNLNVKVRSKMEWPVRVAVPVGTFFLARGGGAQNMVTIVGTTQTASSGVWSHVSVRVACANQHRPIPDDKNTFSIQRAPRSKDLQKAMEHAEKERETDFAVLQAVTWILTDNATYSSLGSLISVVTQYGGPFGFSSMGTTTRRRMITADDTARAMKLLHEAGINIKARAIWGSRHTILKEINDPNSEASKWLRALR